MFDMKPPKPKQTGMRTKGTLAEDLDARTRLLVDSIG